MKLRYISIGPDRDRTPDDKRYEFELSTRFMSNYLSRGIRKTSFTTDGTFDQIGVSLVEDEPEPPRLAVLNALKVIVVYDPSVYEGIKGTNDCEYYLALFEEGFRKAAEFKEIPLDSLLTLLQEFRAGGCKNEWEPKKKSFKDLDIKVTLRCEFTTNNFRLIATIRSISTKEVLCEGIIFGSEPDEIHFKGLFKDIMVKGNKIIITDAGDSQKFLIDLKSAINGDLVVDEYDILLGETRRLVG